MDMTMNKIVRFISVDQFPVDTKTPVAQVLCIVKIPGRGMGDDDVDATAKPDAQTQTGQKPFHLSFGVLHRSAVIPAGSFQPEEVYAVELFQGAVKIDTSLRRFGGITDIVIAFHIKQGHIELAGQESQVFRRQIAAGQYQVYTLIFFGQETVV